jgi:diaminopimelate decarboxylase
MSYPRDFFSYQNGILTSQGVSLNTVAQSLGTPTYVYSADAFLSNLHELEAGLQGIDHQICFAMKSNSNLAVIRLLSQAGAGVDVVSGGELFRAQKAGVPHHRIVFSGVGKTVKEMKEGLTYQGKGIYSFNIESEPELSTLNQVASELKVIAPVALRFNPDVDPKTHPYISTGIKKNKFGMNRNEILKIIQNLSDFPNIHIKGISIHIGSQLLSISPLEDAFVRLASLVDEIRHPLEFLDLGGGFGISYGEEKPPEVRDYCQLIHKIFGANSKYKGRFKIVLEPGRQISGNSGILLTRVLYRKKRPTQDFLIVDAAMNDLVRPALYGSYHDIIPIDQTLTHGKTKKTSVVGPVCESADFLGKNRMLSVDLKPDDLLAVLSSGAYGFTMSGQYNSRPQVAEVLIQNGKFHLIRKRQTYQDLIEGEVCAI